MGNKIDAAGAESPLSERHIAYAFLAGFALIIAGFAVEVWVPATLDFIDSFRANYVPPAAPPGGGEDHGPLSLFVLLLKELGVACWVAGIIGWAIEKQAREIDNERARQLREKLASDAIFAIYGLRHSKEFVMAVVEENLRQMIVRENLKLGYRVRNLTEAEAETISSARHKGAALTQEEAEAKRDDALNRFVMLEMNSSYSFRNVAGRPEDVAVRLVIHLLQGEGARQLAQLRYVSIGKQDVTAAFGDCRTSCEGDDELCYQWVHPRLAPKESLEVTINARCVKGRSDKEVWGSFFPTMGEVELSLEVPPGMRFGAKSLSNAELDPEHYEAGDPIKSWKIKGPLLRHSAMFVWWRKPEDDAEDVDPDPAQFAAPDPPPDPAAIRSKGWRRFAGTVRAWLRRDDG